MRFKLLREGAETDSLGNVLSDEQVKYFKNSKIRDRQGRLLVVHHGTFSSFNQFDKGDIGFHFGTEKAAQERQDFTDPDRVIKKEWKIGQYYLNITNFLDMYDIGDWDGSNLAAHIIESRLLPLSDEEIRYLQQIQMMGGLGMGRNHDPTLMLREFLLKKGIDGIMYENAYEDDGSISYVALNPEQIKSITNKTPTSSKNLNEESDNLSYDKFEQSVYDCANVIVEQITSSFLDKYGFEIDLITDYEDYDIDEHCVGLFLSSEQDDASVFPIVLNPKAMYNALLDISDTIERRDIVGAVKSTLWHEVGHGIVSYLSEVFDFDWDEEEVVEEFAIQMCDTGRADCDLTDALNELEDDLLEEDKIVNKPVNKKLTESLQRLTPNAFITDSPYQIRDLLINKPKLYRILYDSNIDMYMIGDGNEYIHWDLIRLARKYGYYAEMEEFIDELGDLSNYVEFGEGGQFLDDEEIESYLIYMVYSPDDDTFILGEDGYQFKYPLSQGVMFTRDSYLEDCDLYRVLKSMMSVSLTEAKKDFSDRYPSVDEVQEYINNNYGTDSLPPTGATFLMPNGLFVDLGASHMTVHQEFDEQVYNDLVEGGDYLGEYGYTDLFLPRLGFIRCNDGTTMGSLLIHLPSQKPTRQQYVALEEWLEATLSMEMHNYIIIATDSGTKRYDLGDYMVEELMALIKRYYSSGRLYEEDEREDNPQNTPNKEETSDEEPDIIDKVQEIKDNIKASFTENS